MSIRDVRLFVQVVGDGYPLVLMHGGPGADHWTMLPGGGADWFTLVLYDHRCNGRSVGAPASSMTWENLAADADAKCASGWGSTSGPCSATHSAATWPSSTRCAILTACHISCCPIPAATAVGHGRTRLTCCQARLQPREGGADPRWFNGEFGPNEMLRILMRIGGAYYHHPSIRLLARDMLHGGRQAKMRPEALIYAGRHLVRG